MKIKDLIALTKSSYPKAGEGTFICELTAVQNTKSKANKPVVTLQFRVVEGSAKGAEFTHYMSYATDKGAEIVATQLCVLATHSYGITEAKIEDEAETVQDLLSNAVAELSKKLQKKVVRYEVTRKKEGDFYHNKWKVLQDNAAADIATTDVNSNKVVAATEAVDDFNKLIG